MNALTSASHRSRFAAFTLIEMIGVMAILAILSAVLVPNGVRAVDRAAVKAEVESLNNLGDQVKGYLRAKGGLPGLTMPLRGWNVDLATYADLSPADVLTNRRQNARAYIYEPVATPKRVMILSSMRVGLALPTAANLNTVARFDDVWNTADRAIPPTGVNAWAGWATWRATGGAADFLVVERINLASIYQSDLKDLAVTFNNKTPDATATPPVAAATPSFRIVLANGTVQARQVLAALPSAAASASTTLRPRDRIDFYRDAVSTAPESSYVLSAESKTTFDFTGTTWIPR